MKKSILFFLTFLLPLLNPPFVFAEESPRNIRIDVFIEQVGYETAYGAQTSFSQKTQQFITTLEGYEGTIFVGKRVPYVVEIKRYLAEHQYVDYGVVMTDVGTQLRVVPRVRGDVIELEITPEISYETAQGNPQTIQVYKLSSTIAVPNGQTVQLGSVVTDSEFFDLFYRNEHGERLTISVAPQILE